MIKEMTKGAKIVWIATAAVSIATVGVLIAAAFIDLSLAQSIFLGQNIFSDIFASIGKLPAFLFVLLACSVLLVLNTRKGKFKNVSAGVVVLRFVYAIGSIGAATLMFLGTIEDIIEGIYPYIISGGLGFAGSVIMFGLVQKLSTEKLESLKKWAFFAIFSIAIIMVATFAIKLVWGRSRYVDIIAKAYESKFSPWYIPQGFTGNKSMPSGHTALSIGIFLGVPLVWILCKRYAQTMAMLGGGVLFVLLVMISRMAAGQHFLSDVTIGFVIGLKSIFLCAVAFFGKNFNKFTIKDNSLFSKF